MNPGGGRRLPDMANRMLFVNLPVKDLDRSIDFFTDLGFEFDPQFTDDSATCMVVNDQCSVMLLDEARFKDFTTKAVVDAGSQTETILCLSAESRADVDDLVDKAIVAGGSAANDPMDHGFMYSRSFNDPDGHLWEVLWMDPSALAGEGAA